MYLITWLLSMFQCTFKKKRSFFESLGSHFALSSDNIREHQVWKLLSFIFSALIKYFLRLFPCSLNPKQKQTGELHHPGKFEEVELIVEEVNSLADVTELN